jgi:hypothetical protein
LSGSTIGGVVGGIVGFFIPGVGPQLGFMIGSAIGGYVDPVKIQGPRLSDASRQTSQDGVPIPFGYGTFPTAGNVIWTDRLIERKKTSRQGKGGPKVTEYTYTRSYAIGICEGPIDGLLMIKRNGKVVYDARTAQDIPAAIPTPGGGGLAGEALRRVIASLNAQRQGFLGKATIYLGDEDQLPDATIEAVEGAGNVPAHRGMAYMVVKDDDLTDLQGAIPQFEFVVAKNATETAADTSELVPGLYGRFADQAFPLVDPEANYTFTGKRGSSATFTAGTIAEVLAHFSDYYGVTRPVETYLGYFARQTIPGDIAFSAIDTQESVLNSEYLILVYNEQEPDFYVDSDPASFCPIIPRPADGEMSAQRWCARTGELVWMASIFPPPSGYRTGYNNCTNYAPISGTGNFPSLIGSEPVYITVQRKRYAPTWSPSPGYVPIPDVPGAYVGPDGDIEVPVTYESVTGSYKLLALPGSSFNTSAGPQRQWWEVGPVIEADSEDDTEAFWEAAYAEAVADGTLPAGWTYGNEYPEDISQVWRATTADTSSLTLGSTLLSSIVSDLCARAGLAADEVDTADLTDVVRGYRVASEGGADSMIAPLMGSHFFDVGEWDGKLRFVKRGGALAFSIGADDLAERDGDAVTLERVQEAELLRRVTVGYIDPAADYAITTQKWERRAGTVEAKGEATSEVPLVLSADEAAQVAEKKGKIAWSETEKALFSLPALKWARLTPTDVGTLYLPDGDTMRIRVASREEDSGALLVEASRDRQAAYTGTATGTPPIPPSIIDPPLIGPTLLAVMDLPVLRDVDDKLGVYVAVAGLLGGWRGATLEISTDAGVSYTEVAELTRSATMGTTTTALTAWTSSEYPSPQSLTVKLPAAPESVDYATLLRYANRAAVQLSNGQWEVLQYQTVVSNGSGSYTLSGLLRGRYNTTPGAIAAGARFVLLDDTVTFIELEGYLLGQSVLVRAVPLGVDPDTITGTAFSVVNPKSQTEWPVHRVRSTRDAGDLFIEWIGRARLGTDDTPRHSQYFGGYRVTITDGTTTKHFDTQAQAYVYASADQVADFGSDTFDATITVAPINLLTGVGTGTGEAPDTGSLASWTPLSGAAGWSVSSGVITYDPVAGGAATARVDFDGLVPFRMTNAYLPRMDASCEVSAAGESLGAVGVTLYGATASENAGYTGGTRVAAGVSTVTSYAFAYTIHQAGVSLVAWTDGTNPVSFSNIRYSIT